MFELEFEEIAKQSNYTYEVQHFKVEGTIGSAMPITVHRLDIEHKGVTINSKYELGNHNLAEMSFSLGAKKRFPDFSIETKDPFSRLFSFNKKIWKIKCKEKQVVKKITELLDLSGLTNIADKEAFEPTIKADYKDGRINVYTRYYLGFRDKEKSIKPVIEFHLSLINHIKNEYSF